MSLYGLYKAAAVSPRVTVADPEKNAASALTMIRQAAADGGRRGEGDGFRLRPWAAVGAVYPTAGFWVM